MSSWWIALGYPPFDDGKGGFPRTGQVVKHYREQKRDDTGKPWTQRKLALHLKVTEQTVRDIENRDASIDVERRQFLSNLFAIPSILLGIVTREEILKMVEQERAKGDTPIASTSVPSLTLWWVELEYPSFGHGLTISFTTNRGGNSQILVQANNGQRWQTVEPKALGQCSRH